MMGDEKVNATSQKASVQSTAHAGHESCFVTKKRGKKKRIEKNIRIKSPLLHFTLYLA